MGQDFVGLDFDEICKIGRCPKTALPPGEATERRSAATRRSHRRDDLLVLNDKFLEINFGKYRSVSCKSVPDRPKGIEAGLELNRSSVYESSAEAGRTSNVKKFERRRRKIELPRGSDTSSCLSIVDSLCSSDEEIESSRSSAISSWADVSSKCDCSSRPSSTEGLRRNCENPGKVPVHSFSKSFSVRAERPPPLFVSESRRSSQSGSTRTRFSPVKKMLDPLVKSKSSRSPLSRVSEDRAVSTTFTKDSPVQLHGRLERKEKHSVPLFVFSMDCPEEVLVAKTWKENNSFDWVYTFHSVGTVSEDCRRESSMIGQMQVACNILSEPRSDGSFHDSLVTEFVLYDTAHVTQSTSRSPSRTSPRLVGRTNRVDDISSATKLRHGTKSNAKGRDRPLASVELSPELEVAAVVVQVPYAKRDTGMDDSTVDTVKVLVPAGNHGSGNSKGSGPSCLLERWRAGGGCDCGGWDMACPLVVLGNPSVKFDDRLLVDEDNPLRLLAQGTKDRVPALTMKFLEGHYEVDFHAQLSSLQAFSICVAMSHSIEAIKTSRDDNERNPRSGAPPETLIKEEAQILVDPIRKMVNVAAPSYLINPPFSPIARV